MGLTPFLMRMHHDKISQEDLDIVRERNLKSENDASYKVPDKFSASIPKRVMKTTYDDRNWTDMDQTHSNFTSDDVICPMQINNPLGLDKATVDKICAKYKADLQKKYEDSDTNKPFSDWYKGLSEETKKSNFAEWYKEWKDTEGGQLVLGGIKTGLSSLWDKLFPPKATTYVPPVDDKKGLSPIGWGLIAVGGVAILMTVLVLLAKGGKTETQVAQ